jgi:hypothetical protein
MVILAWILAEISWGFDKALPSKRWFLGTMGS